MSYVWATQVPFINVLLVDGLAMTVLDWFLPLRDRDNSENEALVRRHSLNGSIVVGIMKGPAYASPPEIVWFPSHLLEFLERVSVMVFPSTLLRGCSFPRFIRLFASSVVAFFRGIVLFGRRQLFVRPCGLVNVERVFLPKTSKSVTRILAFQRRESTVERRTV